ncbi:MAG: hypothetical protein E1N59_582 [Puniceicoccaceae bacterium 5H]|nr:MAG: hypothetical protein E1N59_582 [Puniceicoccaceae bacterium 5H]
MLSTVVAERAFAKVYWTFLCVKWLLLTVFRRGVISAIPSDLICGTV